MSNPCKLTQDEVKISTVFDGSDCCTDCNYLVSDHRPTHKEDTEQKQQAALAIFGGNSPEALPINWETDSRIPRILALINRETVKAQEDLITRLNDKYPHLPSIEDIAANVVSENRDWVISVLFEFDLFGGELHRTKEQLQGER